MKICFVTGGAEFIGSNLVLYMLNKCGSDLCADIVSLQRDTGWKPETDFQTGIRHILEKVRKQG